MAEKKTQRYLVTGEMTISCHTYVIATSAAEAEKFANARDNTTLYWI